ncbi:MAG: VOC family protein [Bacteroidota bacterium]
MKTISGIHHVAIICSDYITSRHFYTEILGLKVVAEHYRASRNSWKLDLAIGDQYVIELFSFPSPPPRVSGPEACGLRHLAFAVSNLEESISHLTSHGIATDFIRTDEYTGKRFVFFEDPDGLPVELYEVSLEN